MQNPSFDIAHHSFLLILTSLFGNCLKETISHTCICSMSSWILPNYWYMGNIRETLLYSSNGHQLQECVQCHDFMTSNGHLDWPWLYISLQCNGLITKTYNDHLMHLPRFTQKLKDYSGHSAWWCWNHSAIKTINQGRYVENRWDRVCLPFFSSFSSRGFRPSLALNLLLNKTKNTINQNKHSHKYWILQVYPTL